MTDEAGADKIEGNPGLPLADTIEDLRSELLKAMTAGIGQKLHFRLKPIELELSLAITGSGKVKGGIKFWVVEFGGEAEIKRDTTYKIKLILEPIGVGGTSIEVASADSTEPKMG